MIPEEDRGQQFDLPKEGPAGLPEIKPEDYQYFGALLQVRTCGGLAC